MLKWKICELFQHWIKKICSFDHHFCQTWQFCKQNNCRDHIAGFFPPQGGLRFLYIFLSAQFLDWGSWTLQLMACSIWKTVPVSAAARIPKYPCTGLKLKEVITFHYRANMVGIHIPGRQSLNWLMNEQYSHFTVLSSQWRFDFSYFVQSQTYLAFSAGL